MNGTFSRTVEILSIEDNLADITMISEIFERTRVKANLTFVNDGDEAMDYLLKKGKYTSAKRPNLILLDLNLPKKDGRAVLKEVKENAQLKHIPVLILTTSGSKKDVLECYGLHANCYFTKPDDLSKLEETVKAIEDCWLKLAVLPTIMH